MTRTKYYKELKYGKDTSPDPVWSKIRPNLSPHQITSREQLKVGGLYKEVQSGKVSTATLELLALDMPKKDWAKVRVTGRSSYNNPPKDYSYESERSLADLGVVPYKGGMWNSVNYMIPADKADIVGK